MNESIDIYTKYNIDVNKLTRDYLKFPLKKIKLNHSKKLTLEKIPKEDFEYLYIECNLQKYILSKYLNVSIGYIRQLSTMYNIKKSPKQWIKNSKKTNIEKYGVENVFQTDVFKEKFKQTCIEKYGVEHPLQSSIIHEKMKNTILQKYGVENISQLEECKEKKKQTNLEKRGVDHYSKTDEYKEKYKQTCLKHFGVEHPAQSPIVKEKKKQSCLKHFGVENYAQSDEFKNHYKDEEYVRRVKQKEYETKKKNNSFRKSKAEEKIYNILSSKFKEVKRQYKSDLYPFPCDFYIPEKDLYIEYQGYWGHGFEPYLETEQQKEIIKFWKEKGTEQYLRAIDTWTVRDPLKRNMAKQNNLNWIEFFNMKEFMNWFNSI